MLLQAAHLTTTSTMRPVLVCLACWLAWMATPASSRAEDVAMAQLQQGLQSPDADARLDAVRQAGQLGPAARPLVPLLIAALQSDDLLLQYEAAQSLGAIGPAAAAAIEALTRHLTSDAELLQYASVTALRQTAADSPQVDAALQQLLRGKAPLSVRVAAARTMAVLALERHEPLSTNVRELLLAGLESSERSIVADAIHGLAVSDESVTPRIAARLQSASTIEQANACQALALRGLAAQSAGPALVQALATADSSLQRHVLRALPAVAADPGAAVPAIMTVLGTAEAIECKVSALHALGEFGPEAADAVPAITALLKHQDDELRSEAAATLGQIGVAAAPAVPQLIDALRDENGLVAVEAAHALGRIGQPSVGPVSDLLTASGYEELAATILGDIGPAASAAVPHLTKLLATDDANLRRAVLLALSGIGPQAAPAVPRLLEMLDGPDSAAHAGAAYALARIGATETIPDLSRVHGSTQDERVRLATAWALVILQPEAATSDQAIPTLIAGLNDPWELVRRECAVALGTLGTRAQSSADSLAGLLEDEDSNVRAEALVALAKVGAAEDSLLPRCLMALADDVDHVRYAAAFVLGSMGTPARGAVPQLREMLNQRGDLDRILAAWALVKIEPTPAIRQQAVPLMLRALRHPAEGVRREAASLLGDLADRRPAVLDALRQTAAAEAEVEDVRAAARASLQKLTSQ